jgi:hypothetical protein
LVIPDVAKSQFHEPGQAGRKGFDLPARSRFGEGRGEPFDVPAPSNSFLRTFCANASPLMILKKKGINALSNGKEFS